MFIKGFIFVCVAMIMVNHTHAETMIVKLKPGFKAQNFNFRGINKLKAVVPELGIYTIEVPTIQTKSKLILAALQKARGILYAQQDHQVTQRSLPNDQSFKQQWDMLFDGLNFGVDAAQAWSRFGTGGVDAAGNEIVVAVVDAGIDSQHEDLAQNMWINPGEIPGNLIDDDHNGYIDDIHGWNAYTDSGTIPADMHGTHVAGTVGAVGNNGLHGTGINWNVKIMAVAGSSGKTSVILKAYGYILKQKQLWLSSAGQQGANVVVTNSSFGVDYGDCKSGSFPVWNDMYNEMGQVGILSAIATANMKIDVDTQGDVPTGCDSEYIIAVTNTKKDGVLNRSAGWGQTMIDLAAPGTDIFSTLLRNGWGKLTGTSMSTPHVAGAVAYMHSAANKAYNDSYYKTPGVAALALKSILLKNVTPMADLKDKMVSGGILNVNLAATAISLFELPVAPVEPPPATLGL